MDQKRRPLTLRLMGVFALVGFGPLLAQFFVNLWRFDIYQFFPAALLGVGLLAKRGWEEVRRPLLEGSKWVSLTVGLYSFGLLAAAVVLWSPWLGVAAFMLAVVAVAWELGGVSLFKDVFPAWIVLLTIIPPPLNLADRFALLLQQWAVAGSSWALSLLAVPNHLSALVIEIPGKKLLVEEACSGINSVLLMTSACVFYAMWKRRSLVFLAVLYILTIGCILAGNILRITSCAWVYFNFRIDLFGGWKHELLGFALMGAYLLFIVGADALLGKLADRPEEYHGASPDPKRTPLLEGIYFEGGLRAAAILLLILGAAQLGRGWQYYTQKEESRKINPDWMDGSAKFTMPAELDGWRLISDVRPVPKRAAFEDGVFSHIWQYEKDGTVATISLDYPFFDYHDVTVCYRNSGWMIKGAKLETASVENDHIPCKEVVMLKDEGLGAVLYYSTVDESGVWLESPGSRSPFDEEGNPLKEGNVASRFIHRMSLSPFANHDGGDTINYRIQALAAARGGLGKDQRKAVKTLFQKARLLLAEQFVSGSADPGHSPRAGENFP